MGYRMNRLNPDQHQILMKKEYSSLHKTNKHLISLIFRRNRESREQISLKTQSKSEYRKFGSCFVLCKLLSVISKFGVVRFQLFHILHLINLRPVPMYCWRNALVVIILVNGCQWYLYCRAHHLICAVLTITLITRDIWLWLYLTQKKRKHQTNYTLGKK